MLSMDNKRKRASSTPELGPAAKRPALALDQGTQERLRGDVRALYQRFQILCDTPGDGAEDAAFQALLDAAQGAVRRCRCVRRLRLHGAPLLHLSIAGCC
jgi:hypothetical protein